MQEKTVKLTLIDGSVWFVANEVLSPFNVKETPVAVISNHIRGSAGPLLKVNKTSDFSGEESYINTNFILVVDIEYN